MYAETTFYGSANLNTLVLHLVRDYLAGKGYQMDQLSELPEGEKKMLMTAACTYASLKLAEIESRSRFIEKIRIDT